MTSLSVARKAKALAKSRVYSKQSLRRRNKCRISAICRRFYDPKAFANSENLTFRLAIRCVDDELALTKSA